jgi:FkbM family methyltransferase
VCPSRQSDERIDVALGKFAMTRSVHRFENGVGVYDDQLVPEQRKRYGIRNVHEIEEEDLFLGLLRSLPAEGCFLSIGSAIGYYPLLAKSRSPRLTIHAIEPLELHRTYFRDNIALNEFAPSDFTLHPFGASRSDGSAVLVEDRFMSVIQRSPASMYHRLRSAVRAMLVAVGLRPAGRTTTIATRSLDSIVAVIGRPVDLCQMDIQGLEGAVLKGAAKALRAKAIQTFLIGTHGRQVHRECVALLKDAGYRIEVDRANPKDQPDGILIATAAAPGAMHRDRSMPDPMNSKHQTH